MLSEAHRERPVLSAYVATIRVRPKAEVRDPQGEAIGGALRSLGMEVADVRTGKVIVVRFTADSSGEAQATATRMGDELLANPVIEEFEIEVTTE